MQAWHNETSLKAAAVARLKRHREWDDFMKGRYWMAEKGCYLGCLTHEADYPIHSMETLFGLHRCLSRWLEALFEAAPEDKLSWWAVTSAEAILVGADTEWLYWKLVLWLVRDSGLIEKDPELIGLVEFAVLGEIDPQDWQALLPSGEWCPALWGRWAVGVKGGQPYFDWASFGALVTVRNAWEKVTEHTLNILGNNFGREHLSAQRLRFLRALESGTYAQARDYLGDSRIQGEM